MEVQETGLYAAELGELWAADACKKAPWGWGEPKE